MGTPLTEERFLEFVKVIDIRLTRIEEDIAILKQDVAVLKQDVALLKRDMKEVRAFQDYESKTIEYELQALLETHLKTKYPFYDVKEFPMRRLYDPITDSEITELDAAFLLSPIIMKADYSRLKERGVYKKYEPVKPTNGCIFVMAEAKHHITTDKIALKLNQFNNIRAMFKAAKDVANGDMLFSETFKKTVARNPYLANIQTGVLFFGAAYWGGRLVKDFENDVKQCKEFVKKFALEKDSDKKYRIYLESQDLESKWRDVNLEIKSVTEVASMKQLTGTLRHVELITPSGNRYLIKEEKEPEPFAFVGGKTRKKLIAKHETCEGDC
jgi:hypothetical protein